MMELPIYQVDAFTEKLFGGNPAAVVMLGAWLPDSTMQSIAAENNLAETAFLVPVENQIEIRWFTPLVEVDLCGHATLAAAHVMFKHFDHKGETIQFFSPRSGELSVSNSNEQLTLNFPVDEFKKVESPRDLIEGLGSVPLETYLGKTDYMAVFATQQDVEYLSPNFELISRLKARGVIVTSKGTDSDFVSRFFAPQCGINEDPVTGSAHTTLTPYWSRRLNKKVMVAFQLSSRKGLLMCENANERILISGKAVTYLEGKIFVH